MCSCVWIYTCFGEIYCLHLLSRPRRWMQHVVPKHLTPKDHRPNHLVYIYMTFSLKRDSNVYTHINLAPFSCVHRKQQDGSTTSPMGSKSLPRRTISLKADSVLTRYSFQSQRRHQGVWGRRRFNQTVVVMFACVWRLSLSPARPRRHPEVALRTLLPVPSGSGYDLPKDLGRGGDL